MTLLSAGRIRERLSTGPLSDRLIITPILDPGSQLAEGSASLDIRLGFKFKGAIRTKQSESDPYSDVLTIDLETYYVPFGDYFVLHPRHFVLGQTLEYMRFPRDLGAYVVGRSTWGRHGLIIATAVGIHPGWCGSLTLELTNLGEIPLRLWPGSPIAQLFVHTVEQTDTGTSDPSIFVGGTRPELGTPQPDIVMQRALAIANRRAAKSGINVR